MGRSTRLPYRQRRRHISSISYRGLVQHDGADELVASRHPTPPSSYKWRLFHFVHVAHCPWTSRVNPSRCRVVCAWLSDDFSSSVFFRNCGRSVSACLLLHNKQKKFFNFFFKGNRTSCACVELTSQFRTQKTRADWSTATPLSSSVTHGALLDLRRRLPLLITHNFFKETDALTDTLQTLMDRSDPIPRE